MQRYKNILENLKFYETQNDYLSRISTEKLRSRDLNLNKLKVR